MRQQRCYLPDCCGASRRLGLRWRVLAPSRASTCDTLGAPFGGRCTWSGFKPCLWGIGGWAAPTTSRLWLALTDEGRGVSSSAGRDELPKRFGRVGCLHQIG